MLGLGVLCLFLIVVLWDRVLSTRIPLEFNIVEFGAVPAVNGTSTLAIAAAVRAAGASGNRADVVVPRGQWLTGTVSLASGVHLKLDAGAELLASNKLEDYPADNWDWVPAVLDTSNASDTGIHGEGIIDGQAIPLWVETYDPAHGYIPIRWDGVHGCVGGECRPNLVRFSDCNDVKIRGVTLRNSPDWTFLCRRCNNVDISQAHFLGDHQFPNNDGMDFESGSNISIQNTEINTGDDGICLSSGNTNPIRYQWWPLPAAPVRNVMVRDCTIRSKSSAIKFSAIHLGNLSNHNDMFNMSFSNIRIWDSSRGIGVQQRTGSGSIHHLTFVNITIETLYPTGTNWWGSGEPIWITSVPQSGAKQDALTGSVHDVLFRNISIMGENGILLSGFSQGMGIERIRFEDVRINITVIGNTSCSKGIKHISPTGCRDYRPIYPIDKAVVYDNTSAIYLEGKGSAYFGDVAVNFRGQQPYWLPTTDGGTCLNAGSWQIHDTSQRSEALQCTSPGNALVV